MNDLYPFAGHYVQLAPHPSPLAQLAPHPSPLAPRMHFIDEGSGPPVVMVHGNPTWSFYYRDLVKALRDDYRTVVPDHVGCGLSDKPGDDRYAYTLDRRVDDLERLLDHLGLTAGLTLVLH